MIILQLSTEQEPVSPDCQSDYESDMDTASSQSSDSESE
jgi:hypothetical protein